MVDFTRETLTDPFVKELGAMLDAHFDELRFIVGDKADPDWLTYRHAESAGNFVMYTARVAGKLVGYAGFTIARDPHCKSVVRAVQDLVYVTPEHRGRMVGYRLMKYADARLGTLGVDLVMHSVNVNSDFGPMLERMGYEQTEKVYQRRLQ